MNSESEVKPRRRRSTEETPEIEKEPELVSTGQVGEYLGFPLRGEYIVGVLQIPDTVPAKKVGRALYWKKEELPKIRDAIIKELQQLN